MPRLLLVFALLLASSSAVPAQGKGVVGDWREPGGSVLGVFACGDLVCMRVMALRPHEPLTLNTHDPDPSRRSLPVCNLQIGYDFHPQGPEVAKDGRIYDPESGHTYHAQMRNQGDVLHLRGYILLPAFGRTESWKRVPTFEGSCTS